MVEGFLYVVRRTCVFTRAEPALSRYAAARPGSFRSTGDLCVRDTPGPISNPAVKPDSADGTWRDTARESRSSPIDLSLHSSAHSHERALRF